MNGYFLAAAAADFIATVVHGFVGHRRFVTPMREEALPATPTGDAGVSRLIFIVAWHVVTASFALSGAAMLWLSIDSSPGALWVARFVGVMHGGYLIVGLAVFSRRLSAIASPIPIVFATCMVTVVIACWLVT